MPSQGLNSSRLRSLCWMGCNFLAVGVFFAFFDEVTGSWHANNRSRKFSFLSVSFTPIFCCMDSENVSLEERKIAIADEAISELTREPIIDFGWEKARENSYRRTIALMGDGPFELSFMVDVAVFSNDDPDYPDFDVDDSEFGEIDLLKHRLPDIIWGDFLASELLNWFEDSVCVALTDGENIRFADERVQKVFEPVFLEFEQSSK